MGGVEPNIFGSIDSDGCQPKVIKWALAMRTV